MAFAAGNALAQHKDGGHFKGPGKPPPGRMVDQRQPPRPERMSPEDREKLRRDIDDANRRMERRR